MQQKIDILNRENFIIELIDILEVLSSNKTGCCFAIDGTWGSGKTFVLDMLKYHIKNIQSEETNTDKYFLFHYNCWKYDYYEEPSIAIISSIKDSIDEEFKTFTKETDSKIKASWEVAKENIGKIAGKFIENYIGINVVEIYNDVQKEAEKSKEKQNKYNSMFAFTETLKETRKLLREIAQQKTIVLIVDELDRCIPSYSIKVLERLHHIFDGIDNTIVIIAIDSEQLEHSIKKIYGEDVNINRYLKKFISFKKHLSLGELHQNALSKYESYFSKFNIESPMDICFRANLEEIFPKIWMGVDIREQEKLMNKIEIIHSLICQEKVNLTLALFEIMLARYDSVSSDKDFSWLAKAPLKTKFTIPNFSEEYYNILLDIASSALPDEKAERILKSNRGIFRYVRCGLIGETFWLIGEIYCNPNPYCSESETTKTLIPIATKFKTLLNSIT